MDRNLRELAEAQIRKAEAEGQFEILLGAGTALPAHPEEALIDLMGSVGNRNMAEIACLSTRYEIARDARKKFMRP